jgi:hypothetical protein
MSRLDRPVAELGVTEEAGPHRDRSWYPYWPPRPTTIVAALLVGSSLYWMAFVDPDFARNLSDLYGWPFSFRLAAPNEPLGGLSAAALAADLVIALALLASACATTQVAACLLVRSPRITLRIVGFAIAVIAMFLAGCRLNDNFLADVFYTGFYYSVASLVVLVACGLLRLELPRRDETEQGG